MKRKAILAVLALMLALTSITSCSDSLSVRNETAELSFRCTTEASRSLSRTEPDLDPSAWWWTYEAVKTDPSGLSTGRTLGETKLNGNNKGLGGTIGPFSLGNWTFTLRAYAENQEGVLSGKTYEGSTASFRIDRSGLTVPVKVSPQQTASGYIVVPEALTGNGLTCTLTYLRDGAALQEGPVNREGNCTWTVKSGPWKISISDQEGNSTEICVNVFDHQTTLIDGTHDAGK